MITRALIEIDGRLSDQAWSQFRDAVVPDGMFVIRERASSAWVGTISAFHNPKALVRRNCAQDLAIGSFWPEIYSKIAKNGLLRVNLRGLAAGTQNYGFINQV